MEDTGRDRRVHGTDGDGLSDHVTEDALRDEIERLSKENWRLRRDYASAISYIRRKVDQLLTVMGTSPLRPEELDDESLIGIDPIGIISDSFVQVLRHLHRTNDRLRLSNEEIKAIFDSAGMGILVIDRDMNILAHNAELKEHFFPDSAEMIGRACFSCVCNLSDPVNACPFAEIFTTGSAVHRPQWLLRGRYYNVVGTPVKGEQGDVSRVVMVYMDITDRIRAMEALKLSEERYRDLFENANDLIQIIAPDGSVLYANRAWHTTLGYDEAETADLTIFDIIHPECVDECSRDFRAIILGERSGKIETAFLTKAGQKITVEGNISSITDGERFIGTRGIFRDITKRKAAEEALAAEKEHLAVTLRSIGDGVITTDINGNILLMNRVAEQLTGYSQEVAAGMPVSRVFQLISERTREYHEDPVAEVLRSGRLIEVPENSILISRDGTERLISDSVAPIRDKSSSIIGAVLVFRDITERRKLEEELLKSEKLESLGVLAGGIAHDFNNLLSVLIGNIDLAASLAPPGSEIQNILSKADKASVRASDLTKQLLTFSRGGAPIRKSASIADLVRDSVDFVLRGSSVRCEFSLPADLREVMIDEGQISQVITNLVINAVQAMPDGGTLRIASENVTVGPGNIHQMKDGEYVRITIQDEGVGIPKENLLRIFEPYFTTKEKGTGLGLATSYSIIKSHDGHIDVDSEVGRGSAFTLYLPAVSAKGQVRKAHSGALPGRQAAGRVLVMDDDELVLSTAQAILVRIGYETEFATNGADAVALYKEALKGGRPFDAVIMDLTIPGGMGGKEALKKLLEIDPKVRAIVSSGYSNDPIMASYREYGFSGVLAKPYRINEVREIMEGLL